MREVTDYLTSVLIFEISMHFIVFLERLQSVYLKTATREHKREPNFYAFRSHHQRYRCYIDGKLENYQELTERILMIYIFLIAHTIFISLSHYLISRKILYLASLLQIFHPATQDTHVQYANIYLYKRYI